MLRLLLVIVVVAIALYFAVRMMQGAGPRRGLGGARPRQPGRPIAPDDDPDFLRDLDRKRREQDES
ncbi:MAG: hypothetical protein WAW88_00905 [Nocardioides sp.]|mgnify:CR=1 FL=1